MLESVCTDSLQADCEQEMRQKAVKHNWSTYVLYSIIAIVAAQQCFFLLRGIWLYEKIKWKEPKKSCCDFIHKPEWRI
jgi:hypothetical protein